MAELITLKHFGAAHRHYHIYRIQSSTVAHNTHYHNYFQVCFVTRGELTHGQESSEVILGPGDAFIIPPGFSHSIHFHNVYSQMYSLSFDGQLFRGSSTQSGAQQFLSDLQSRNGEPVRLRVVLDKQQRSMLQRLMDCLMYQQQTDCPAELSAAPSLIESILYLLAQSYYSQDQNADRLDQLRVYTSTLAQCTEYIDDHYKQNISLSDISRLFGMSRSTFCAVFPQFTGMSLRNYIAQKRILEAQILLRAHPGMPLNQIAAEVGYEEMSTFYRNFLRFAGMSPSEYRKLNKK